MKKINEIKGLEEIHDRYYIITCGKIIKMKKDGSFRVTKGSGDGRGYLSTTLSFKKKGVKRKQLKVHRLVAMAFIKNLGRYEQINHINHTKNCNHINNLEWCSRSQNMKHGSKEKTKRNRSVLQFSVDGFLIKIWKGSKEIKESKDFKWMSVISCCNNHIEKYKGYIWKYGEKINHKKIKRKKHVTRKKYCAKKEKNIISIDELCENAIPQRKFKQKCARHGYIYEDFEKEFDSWYIRPNGKQRERLFKFKLKEES